MLSYGQFRDHGLNDLQLGSRPLVLASLDVKVGFDAMIQLGLDQLKRLLNDMAEVPIKKFRR